MAGQSRGGTWASARRTLFGPDGLVTVLRKPWRDYLRADFHPDQRSGEAGRAWGMADQTIHVKGLEPAGYDPRVLKGMGLAYATSDRGACHLRTTFYKPELSNQIAPDAIEGKAALLVDFEDRLNLFDTFILCRFFRDFYPWEELGEVIRLTTGLSLDRAGLQALAARVADQTRRFNLREGLTKDDDWLPDRFFDEPASSEARLFLQGELPWK